MKTLIVRILHGGLPVPRIIKRLLRCLHTVGILLREGWQAFWTLVIVRPIVQSIVEGGKALRVERVPYIRGTGKFVLGEQIYLSGLITVHFSNRGKMPVLKIGDRSFVGHQCGFALAGSIEIGSDCLIAAGTRIQDNDGHPLDPAARLRKERVKEADIKPVRIGNNVWIGARSTILKGVTIGDNAVVGTGSVVTRDVEPGTVVAGNPARVIRSVEGEQ